MQREFLLERLAQEICILKARGPLLVGIDGVDGAGKTTLANELVPLVEAKGRKIVRASIDGFHNPREKRVEKGVLSPDGYFTDSFDYDFLVSNFIKPLKAVTKLRRLRSAKYDWKTGSDVEDKWIDVDQETIVLFEGVFLFRSELQEYWDYVIYLQIDPETSLQRGLVRDSHLLGGVDSTREKYMKRYIPGQGIYHAKHQPASKASIVVKNDDPYSPEVLR